MAQLEVAGSPPERSLSCYSADAAHMAAGTITRKLRGVGASWGKPVDISRSGTAWYRRRNLLIAAAFAIIAAGGAAYWYWPQAPDPARATAPRPAPRSRSA